MVTSSFIESDAELLDDDDDDLFNENEHHHQPDHYTEQDFESGEHFEGEHERRFDGHVNAHDPHSHHQGAPVQPGHPGNHGTPNTQQPPHQAGHPHGGRPHGRNPRGGRRLRRRAPRSRFAKKMLREGIREFPHLGYYFRKSDVEVSPDLLPPELKTPLSDLPPLATCGKSTKLRVRQEPFNSDKPLDRNLLKAILGKPARYIDNEVSASLASFHCIDSRKQGPVLGTPGGDFGEFLVAMSVVEDLISHPFTEDEVYKLLTQWVSWERRGSTPFFHHTDENAVSSLARRLHVNGLTNVLTDVDITFPPYELRDEMLMLLNQTRFQGSRVVRKFLDYPRKYQIRSELTSSLIRSFYKLLWDRETVLADDTPIHTRMNLEVYHGKPNPRAWVSVRSGANCEIAGSAHMVSPLNAVPRKVLEGKPMNKPAHHRNVDGPDEKKNQTEVSQFLSGIGIDTNVYDAFFGVDDHSLAEVSTDAAPSSDGVPHQPVPMAPAEVFVQHPHAVRQLRKWLSRFFALRFPLAASQPKLLQLIERRQQSVLESVAESLGRNVPFYTVTIE